MPPKISKKADKKNKEKLIEDKTFGLKNKNKSKNIQKYINQISHQVKGISERKQHEVKQNKKNKEQLDAEMKDIFKAAIIQPKIPPGVDPKSVLCAFFKVGSCAKGNRCKYSHDLNIDKKSAKIDLYSDQRMAREKDKIDDWDQNKLENVIQEKHGANKQTEIVCKHFLDAIEKSQYGWFWVCPNGGKECKYRHALPPGYVFKTKAQRELEKKNKAKSDEKKIEEIIEQQRAKLGATGGTPVTAETLAIWKEEKKKRKLKEIEMKKKEEAKKTGGKGLLSGRALFTYDPSLFLDDEDAAADEYEVREIEYDATGNPINLHEKLEKSLYINEVDITELE